MIWGSGFSFCTCGSNGGNGPIGRAFGSAAYAGPLTSLSAWAPKDTAWLFPWVTAAKLLAALALLALWTRLFVRIRWNMCSDWPYLLAGLFFLVLAYALSYLPSLPLPVAGAPGAEQRPDPSVPAGLGLFASASTCIWGGLALTVGIALLILATLFLFCWGYYQLPRSKCWSSCPISGGCPFCCSVVFCF